MQLHSAERTNGHLCAYSVVDSKDADVLDSRGFVHLKLNQLDKRIADYNAALKIDRKMAEALYGRALQTKKGDMLSTSNGFSGAFPVYENVVGAKISLKDTWSG